MNNLVFWLLTTTHHNNLRCQSSAVEGHVIGGCLVWWWRQQRQKPLEWISLGYPFTLVVEEKENWGGAFEGLRVLLLGFVLSKIRCTSWNRLRGQQGSQQAVLAAGPPFEILSNTFKMFSKNPIPLIYNYCQVKMHLIMFDSNEVRFFSLWSQHSSFPIYGKYIHQPIVARGSGIFWDKEGWKYRCRFWRFFHFSSRNPVNECQRRGHRH